LTPASVRARYGLQEALFRHFEIFTGHDGLPGSVAAREGRRPASG
jgi:hypothetical protein